MKSNRMHPGQMMSPRLLRIDPLYPGRVQVLLLLLPCDIQDDGRNLGSQSRATDLESIIDASSYHLYSGRPTDLEKRTLERQSSQEALQCMHELTVIVFKSEVNVIIDVDFSIPFLSFPSFPSFPLS